jgi:hypothetical protein
MDHKLEGYNEVLITYVLAASSPTYSIEPDVYHEGWARSGEINTTISAYGHELEFSHNGSEEYGGPLFWAHYSYLGLDPRGLSDRYSADYLLKTQKVMQVMVKISGALRQVIR